MGTCSICSNTIDDECLPANLCSRCSVLFTWFVKHFVTDQEKDFININTTFHDLNIESLDYIEWVSEAENKFGVVIGDDEAESLRTVRDYLSFIVQHANKWPGSLHGS